MTKVVLTNPASFVADASAVAQVTNNNAAITAAVENTLSRDGTGPNQMAAPFDMNGNRILNLPVPLSPLEPVRLLDVSNAATLAGALAKVNNLSDLTNATVARASLVLDQVANTSDANKPVSTAQATALALKAPLISPVLVTPALGVATVTSLNGNTFTVGTYTLTGLAGKILTFNNSLTLVGVDGTTLTFQGTDTYVGRATTDTLTNKTFDTAGTGNVLKINGATVNTPAQLTTQVNVATNSTSGAVPALPNDGTKFYNGLGAFATPPSAGQMILLNTLTASNSATLSDTTSLTATYSVYEIIFENLLPATTSVSGEVQVHSGGAFQATGYLTNGFGVAAGAIVADTPTTFLPITHLTSQLNSGPGVSGFLRIHTPSTAAIHSVVGQFSYTVAGPGAGNFFTAGYWNSAAVIDGFQFLFSTGNITSGTIKIYGIQ